jgi:Flp pilus assembly protein TadB
MFDKKKKKFQKTKRQDQLAKRQVEIQREAEQKKKEESEKRFRARRGANADSDLTKPDDSNSRASTPATTRQAYTDQKKYFKHFVFTLILFFFFYVAFFGSYS